MTDALWRLVPGASPLIVDVPHAGTELPPEVADALRPEMEDLRDTDFNVDELYDFAVELGATIMVARLSRWAVDLNRPPDDEPLYPGRAGTGVVADVTFDGEPLWKEGRAPDQTEIARRVERYWRPYHAKLAAQIERVRARHGYAILWDGHSIRSEVPRLFEGRLPDLNLGTADGASCASALRARLADIAGSAEGYTSVLDGRFKGGFVTRFYGRPGEGVHAVQLELAQTTHLAIESRSGLDPARTAHLVPVLRRMLEAALEWGAAAGRRG